MTDRMKTEFVGFGQAPTPEARKPARKRAAKRSAPDKAEKERLPRKKRGDRSHFAMMESIMAEARGDGGRGGKVDDLGEGEVPKQTKAGVSRAMEAINGVLGAPVERFGEAPRQGRDQRTVLSHTESTQKYVQFMAEMTVDRAFDSKPRPPRPTGG